MIDLERALSDLADHLDYPAGAHRAEALRQRLGAAGPARTQRIGRARVARALLVAAAVLVLAAAGVVAIAPARHAVADWLGIGAVEIRRSEQPLPTASGGNPVPGSPGTARAGNAGARLAAARGAVQFAIAVPSTSTAGVLADVEVDRRVPGGLVALSYARFTLVEIATDPSQPMPLAKQLGGIPVQNVTVNGQPGGWIAAPHVIGYVDRTGTFARDTVRRSGPVLLWERAGVTYRIEGLHSLTDAQSIAATLR
jgi:hypothetical protein